MDKLGYLRSVDLFAGLSEEELRRCEQELPMLRVPKGKLLFTPTRHEEALYVVKAGSVRLYRLSRDGREVTLGTVEAGEVFGTLPMFGTASRNTFAEAASDAVLCVIHEPQLQGLVRAHPEIAIRLLRVVGERLAAMEDLAEDLVFRSASQRVARALLRLVDRAGSPELRVSHEEVAKLAGVARETVTKVLDGMKRQGWLELGYRSLRVLDRDKIGECASD